jgi:hypothetical protein
MTEQLKWTKNNMPVTDCSQILALLSLPEMEKLNAPADEQGPGFINSV